MFSLHQLRDHWNKYIGVGISFPILSGLDRNAGIRKKKLNLQRVRNSIEEEKLHLRNETEQIVLSLHSGWEEHRQAVLQVKITSEMHHIMQLYKRKDSRWVFPFLHEKLVGKGVLTAQSSLHRVNEYLKEIGDRLNLPYPLTTYVMRHSWASLMLESVRR